MKRLLVLLAVLGCLLPGAAASADELPTWLQEEAPAGVEPFDAEHERAFDRAVTFWGGIPADCSKVVKVQGSGFIEPISKRPINGFANHPVGYEPCYVAVATGLSFYETCLIAGHELGHTWGHEHSPDPTSIMYAGGPTWLPNPAPDCGSSPEVEAAARAAAQVKAEEDAHMAATFRRLQVEGVAEQRAYCRWLRSHDASRRNKRRCWRHLHKMILRVYGPAAAT